MWKLADIEVKSRLILGTAQYSSPEILCQSIVSAGAEVVTASLRRQHPSTQGGQSFWDIVKRCQVRILPNTAHCRSAKEAILTAHLARELFQTNWIKLEVIGDEASLAPDPFELVEAARTLCREGFEVFPYTTEDVVTAERLLHAGCRILMPWASPIGTGQGLIRPESLSQLRSRFPQATLIVDAGIGRPSHAAQAMEMGFDAVLLNSAVALASNSAQMALAFAQSIESGRRAFEAGLMPKRSCAMASTPIDGHPFATGMSS